MGRVREVVGVDERHRVVERPMGESLDRLRSLFEQHPDALYDLDLHGHVVAGNAALARLNGDEVARRAATTSWCPTTFPSPSTGSTGPSMGAPLPTRREVAVPTDWSTRST